MAKIEKSSGLEPDMIGVQNEPVSHEQLMTAIGNEIVRSRIRFRALLRLLISKGLIAMSEYVAEYEDEEHASFAPLVDGMLLCMNEAEYVKKHADWIQSDRGASFAPLSKGKERPFLQLTAREIPPPNTSAPRTRRATQRRSGSK